MVRFRSDVLALERVDKRPRVGILNLGSNELLHPRVDEILVEELARIEAAALRTYPTYRGALRALAEYHQADPERVLVCAGSDDGIRLLMEAFAADVGEMILQVPNYTGWIRRAKLAGMAVRPVEFGSDRAFGFSVGQFARAMASSTGAMVVLSNPNNPTGFYFSRAEIAEIAELAKRRDHLLIIDACYSAFVTELSAAPALCADNVVTMTSFSKSFGLAGARIASIVAAPALTDYLARWQPENPVSGVALQLLERLLPRKGEFLGIAADIAATRERFTLDVGRWAPKWRPLPSHGNFTTFLTESAEQADGCMAGLATVGIRIKTTNEHAVLRGGIKFTIGAGPVMDHVIATIRRTWPGGPQSVPRVSRSRERS